MNFDDAEIANAVRVTLKQLDLGGDLPVVLMPRDPESGDALSRSAPTESDKIPPVE